jgi:hypothetical protein
VKTEKALQNYLFRQAKAVGVYCRKMAAVGRRGFPDVLLAFGGVIIFVELKSPANTGRLSAGQVYEIRALKACGLRVLVIKTKEDADAVIKELIDGDADGGGRPPV